MQAADVEFDLWIMIIMV